MKELVRVEKSNLSSRVYDQIRSALMSGKYVPGERLRVAELAQSMGTSTTPVREAIFRLVSEQALEMTAATSITVPELDPGTVSEIQLMRTLLEGAAAEAAALRITPQEIARLRRTHEAFIKAVSASPREAAGLNRKFHFELLAASHLPNLFAVVESMWVRMGPLLHIFHTELQASRESLEEHPHYRVLDGLARKDPKTVSAAIGDDIQWGKTVLLDWMASREEESV
ncbi:MULTISPECIES: GntR family transcriptional regulator [Cupriavidus]|uniref:GntR family transcriptional regulator n=1 Tax=Cupriavidus TaxID=106589 RepID=UPI000368A800|nr:MULTISPECIES: GntR family transcriptional regulator [Cupriavidus]